MINDESRLYRENNGAHQYNVSNNSGNNRQQPSSKSNINSQYNEDPNRTPRTQKPLSVAVRQSPYYGLQDAQSPVGRLSERIQKLRERCMEALGKGSFDKAYTFLKLFEEVSINEFSVYFIMLQV